MSVMKDEKVGGERTITVRLLRTTERRNGGYVNGESKSVSEV